MSVTVVNSTLLRSSNNLSKYDLISNYFVSEIIVEKLLEQRDFYLNTLKQLEFQLVMEPSEKEIKDIEKLQKTTIDQLKKVEQEIAYLTSKKYHNLQ